MPNRISLEVQKSPSFLSSIISKNHRVLLGCSEGSIFDAIFTSKGVIFARQLTEDETDKTQDEGVKPQKLRKKPGRRPLPPELPREKVIYDIGSDEKICACGHSLHKIGEEISEQLDYIPAQVKVVQNVRYKYGCKGCQETVKLAPLSVQPIPIMYTHI